MKEGFLSFKFGDQKVRVKDRNGGQWFIAKDVCACLDITNHRDALSRLDEDEVGSTDVIDALGRPQEHRSFPKPAFSTSSSTPESPKPKPSSVG